MDSGNLMTLIGAACGFGASVTPEFLGVWKDAKDHTYRMEEKQLELEAAKENYVFQLQHDNTEELKALLQHDTSLDGGKYINALRASVRPVVTYLIVILFCAVKMAFLVTLIRGFDVPFSQAIQLLWDTDTMGIFAAVLSFWFGSRAMDQYRQNMPPKLNTNTTTSSLRSQPKYRKR